MFSSTRLCHFTHRDRQAIWSRVRFPVGLISFWIGGEPDGSKTKRIKNVPWCFVPLLDLPGRTIKVKSCIHHALSSLNYNLVSHRRRD